MAVRDEILEMEERLRRAELEPNPRFFEETLADDVVLDGVLAKAQVVAAHQPTGSAKFTKVEMSDVQVREHGALAAVVTCTGLFEGPSATHRLQFMRVWLKRADRWQIIAGSVRSSS